MADPKTELDAEANPDTDAAVSPGPNVEANPRPDAESDPRFYAVGNPPSVADTNPKPREADGTQDINRKGKPVLRTSSHRAAGADSSVTAVAARKAGNAGIAKKRDLEQQAVAVAKRQKAVSKESQAAMAVITATARLPTQVRTSAPLTVECHLLRSGVNPFHAHRWFCNMW